MNTILNRYNGPAGSIRGMEVCQELNLMASVSLDRFLYLFRLNGRQEGKRMLERVYLKQRLSGLLLCPIVNTFSGKSSMDDSEEDSSSDEDEDSSDDDSFLNGDSDSSLEDIDDVNDDSDESSIDMRDDDSMEEFQSKKKRKKG